MKGIFCRAALGLYLVTGFMYGMQAPQDFPQFEQLPQEIKEYISKFLIEAPNIDTAIQNVSSFLNTNTHYASNESLTNYLIKHLAAKFKQNEIYIAALLGTPGALANLKEYIKKDPQAAKITLLAQATLGGRKAEKIIKSLIDAGIDVNLFIRTGKNKTVLQNALSLAAARNDRTLVDLLKDKSSDKVKSRAVLQAMYNGFDDLAQNLLLTIKDDSALKNLLFNLAQTSKQDSAARLIPLILIRNKVNIDAPTKTGDTALTLAIKKCRSKIIELLLNYGADVNVKVNGQTIDYIALNHNCLDVLVTILNKLKLQVTR